jgi:cyclophilin family peptidyl-prolyl cis-trans isomerase
VITYIIFIQMSSNRRLSLLFRRSACSLNHRTATPAVGSTASFFVPQQLQQNHRRSFGSSSSSGSGSSQKTGSRGARGHGWYVNYRQGKGGRGLQGEYYDRDSLEEQMEWNAAILQLGSKLVFMDVVMEPKSSNTSSGNMSAAVAEQAQKASTATVQVPDVETLLDRPNNTYRLYMDLATAMMPETTDNFIRLCTATAASANTAANVTATASGGYVGSIFYRMESNVGICGGDVLTNTGKTGRAAQPNSLHSPLRRFIRDPDDKDGGGEPMALWHLPGTVSMIVASVQEIDSRFMLCTHAAPHLDGIYRAMGQLTPESLDIIANKWQKGKHLLTRNSGVPNSHQLVIVQAGLVDDTNNVEEEDAAAQAA